jgi:phosphoglycolate phosphatase
MIFYKGIRMSLRSKMKTKLLVFDFDGTLADTKIAWFNSLFKVLKKMNIYCPQCEARVILHLALKIRDFLNHLGLPKKKSEMIASDVYYEFFKQKSRLVNNIDVIDKLPGKKIILSNTRTFAIDKILGKHKKIFNAIYGGDKFKEKHDFIKKLMKKNKLKKSQMYYIADRAGDVETAKKAGCTSLIIASKHAWSSFDEIMQEKPDYVVKKLKELKEIIKK